MVHSSFLSSVSSIRPRRTRPVGLSPLPAALNRSQLSIAIGALMVLMATIQFPAAQAAIPSAHQFIGAYEGAQTCGMCHPNAASEVMATTHWTWEHTDSETGQALGKNNVINNYCIAVGSNEPRCTSCHVGVGYADKTFDFSDATKVDCLACHDTTGTYKKFPTGAGHPVTGEPKEFPPGSGKIWQPLDLTAIAQKAGPTSRATCGQCHFFGGGGDAVKHGDLDSSLFNPGRELDVHMGIDGGNFSCSKCHHPDDHQIPGTVYSSSKTDNQTCENCHSTSPHSEERLNAHADRVACQTCHIPEYARGGKATKMFWDWSTAGEKNADGTDKVLLDADGNPTYDTKKGTFSWEANVVPEYVWFNGTVRYLTLDDQVDPTQILAINSLQGSADDPESRLFPVKRFRGIQPYDAGSGTLAVPHLFGSDADAYWKSYDWSKALAAGMAYVGRPFSGEVGFIETEMFWIQNHMVAPKESALSCADCHVPEGRIDFLALGYEADRAAFLQSLAQPKSLEILTVQISPTSGAVEIAWDAEPASAYRIEASTNLRNWTDAGQATASDGDGTVLWTEPAQASGYRFYRIVRLDP